MIYLILVQVLRWNGGASKDHFPKGNNRRCQTRSHICLWWNERKNVRKIVRKEDTECNENIENTNREGSRNESMKLLHFNALQAKS